MMSDSGDNFSDGSIDFSDDDDEGYSFMTETIEESYGDTVAPIFQDHTNMPIDKVKKKETSYEKKCSDDDIMTYLGSYNQEEIVGFNNYLKKELLKKERTLELVEGVTKCNKCKSNKIYTYQMQTRSGDEAMTTFYVCSVCASKWKT